MDYITEETKKELEEELEERTTEKRKEIADQLKEAKEYGDLSENAAYKEARQKEERNENRIQEIRNILKNAEIIEESTDKSKVGLGDEVTFKEKGSSKEQTFTMVDEEASDPADNKLSIESPLGEALMGKHEGDEIEFEIPSGETKKYELIEIK